MPRKDNCNIKFSIHLTSKITQKHFKLMRKQLIDTNEINDDEINTVYKELFVCKQTNEMGVEIRKDYS